jgi:hypothetical protein
VVGVWDTGGGTRRADDGEGADGATGDAAGAPASGRSAAA